MEQAFAFDVFLSHQRADTPGIYRRGAIAEAEPAVPGCRMAVDDFLT